MTETFNTKELADQLKQELIYSWDAYLEAPKDSYISDLISEAADDLTDFSNYYLTNWVNDCDEAWGFMNDVIQQGLLDTKDYDFGKHIQAAQFMYYESELYDERDEALTWYAFNYLAEKKQTITEEEKDAIESYNFSDCDTLSEICEAVDNEIEY